MEFIVPKSFKIFDVTYKVKQLKKIDAEDSWGEHDFSTHTVKIKRDLNDIEKERTFFHEVLHCALEQLSYHNLSDDEKFVDQLANALHQIIKTSK